MVNYELPNVSETYVHRIGRTGRAGASGLAVSFCDGEEKAYLKDIEKLIGKKIPVINEHPYPLLIENPPKAEQGGRGGNRPKSNFSRPKPSNSGGERSGRSERPASTSREGGDRPRRNWSKKPRRD